MKSEETKCNDALMELMIMAHACKIACARRIIGVIPYLPYCKQSKMNKRGAIPAKLVASLMCKSGLTSVITMDLHSKEIQGFYNIPVDNLRASPFIVRYISESDDIIDDAATFVDAARVIRDRGAYKIYVMVTHGLLSGDAPELIEDSEIDEVVVTNTVAHDSKVVRCSKIKSIDISQLLAEAIRRIHND
ncbi:hypothetical protein QZH41_007791 [Actinostola sp. cb2023]|nr:hypothetical protein QZH41_007791 [Actinostola sp. cb2023]